MGRARQLATNGHNDSLVLDASASDTDVGENLLLERTNGIDDDNGFNILMEDAGTEVSYHDLESSDIIGKHDNHIEFHVGRKTDQAISHNTVTTAIYDTVNKNFNNNASIDGNGVFTCTIPGFYHLKHHYYYLPTANNSAGLYDYNYVRVSRQSDADGVFSRGAFNYFYTHLAEAGGGPTWVFRGSKVSQGIAHLQVGDRVTCQIYLFKSGGTLNTQTRGLGSGSVSYFRDWGFMGTLLQETNR